MSDSAMMVKAVELEPHDLATILACADAFEEEGKDEEAQQYRQRAVEVSQLTKTGVKIKGIMTSRRPVMVIRHDQSGERITVYSWVMYSDPRSYNLETYNEAQYLLTPAMFRRIPLSRTVYHDQSELGYKTPIEALVALDMAIRSTSQGKSAAGHRLM